MNIKGLIVGYIALASSADLVQGEYLPAQSFTKSCEEISALPGGSQNVCKSKVTMSCVFTEEGVEKSCIGPEKEYIFYTVGEDECASKTIESTITMEICNDNKPGSGLVITPYQDDFSTRFTFKNTIYDVPGRLDDLQPGDCREYQTKETIDTCKKNWPMSVKLEGNMRKSVEGNSFCYCFLFKRGLVNVVTAGPSPTLLPSAQPSTESISVSPSKNPSLRPSTRPSSMTSSEPSLQPSVGLTNASTTTPSEKPSNLRTNCPTKSLYPSAAPSKQPNASPSLEPTYDHSIHPTKSHSTEPSMHPSLLPSLEPTYDPTEHTTEPPSNQPSDEHTSCPTKSPTAQPSSEPTRCTENSHAMFFLKYNNKGKPIFKSCQWLAEHENKDSICLNRTDSCSYGSSILGPARDVCMNTCDTCFRMHPSETPSSHPSSYQPPGCPGCN